MAAVLGFNRAYVISKSDTVNLPQVGNLLTCDAIYVGTGGTLIVVFPDDTTCSYKVPSGGTIYVQAKRVNSTLTTADDMVAQYIL